MKPNKLIAGETVVYFPPKKLQSDNEHYPAKIIDGEVKRGRVKVVITTLEGSKKRSVSINRLEAHDDLFGDST